MRDMYVLANPHLLANTSWFPHSNTQFSYSIAEMVLKDWRWGWGQELKLNYLKLITAR